MKVAAVNWKLRDITAEKCFFDHLREVLAMCDDCQVVVLPEMFAMELTALQPRLSEIELTNYLSGFYGSIYVELAEWLEARNESAEESGEGPWTLVGGSNVFASSAGFYNRSPVLTPFKEWHQDKVMLTEWEKEVGLSAGAGLSVDPDCETSVNVCYDSEFPSAAKALAEEGVTVLAVPAWTESFQGFHRVRWCCQARAVENQMLVAHASLVGRVGNETCHGSSAIIAPPHMPFGDRPILAETPMDQEGVAIATLELEWLDKCRESGEVRNWRDRDAGDWTVRIV